ncbi:MAG: helix-turn-helix transcriptional regulator [Phycisphaeraceae bacterium]|nr:helix-turn-helix transcriptional regulator [Phycisphaeraceae bacterium]
MSTLPEDQGVAPLPWEETAPELGRRLKSLLGCDAFAVQIVDLNARRHDGLLATDGFDQSLLASYLDAPPSDDPLLGDAVGAGWVDCSGRTPEAGRHAGLASLLGNRRATVHVVPESMLDKTWWVLVLRWPEGAEKIPDDAARRLRGDLLLRRWHINFNRCIKPEGTRTLLADDGRTLAADVADRWTAIDQPKDDRSILNALRQMIPQWFPSFVPGAWHDLSLQTEAGPRWIRFQQRSATAANGQGPFYWLLESHPLMEDDPPVVGRIEDSRVAEALTLIHHRYRESPTLKNLGDWLKISPFYLHRLFIKEVGISPKQYLQRRQLQMARLLLLSTDRAVGDIAGECGFASHGHFTTTFHRVAGVSPIDFRRADADSGDDPPPPRGRPGRRPKQATH